MPTASTKCVKLRMTKLRLGVRSYGTLPYKVLNICIVSEQGHATGSNSARNSSPPNTVYTEKTALLLTFTYTVIEIVRFDYAIIL